MPSVESRRRPGLVVTLTMVGACTGVVQDFPAPGASVGAGRGSSSSPDGLTPQGASSSSSDPGRVTLHRLNRVEYNNTVQDLLGTSRTPADDFPADDRGSGFDNVADVLSLSPLHLDMYQRSAEQLVNETLAGAQRKSVVSCDVASGASCVENTLRSFARRAWRRPVTDAEVARLMTVVSLANSNGDGNELGLNLALQSILVSPHFVFRVELDSTPTDPTPHPLSAHELATRLSYFLWSTMPDAELSAAADDGTLTKPDVLKAQVARMMASPKASGLVSNFAGQWLYTRKVDEATPDSTKFPNFDDALRDAMKRETELLFEEVAFHGLPANQMLTSNFTFLNDRLAKHYGLPAVGSTELKRVTLTGDQRGGLLSQASMLTVTSHATNTSPVLRGKWVLNELFCQDVPPPPPGVDTKLATETTPTGSLRERLEEHRANPQCAGCHGLMDPIGFGLENYDAIGAYRTMDGTFPVDASGVLPDGDPFSGPKQLAALVAEDERFPSCITEKLFTYALGRAPDAHTMDDATLEALTARFKDGFDFAALVTGIATSDPFLKRRGEPNTGATP